MVADAGDRPRRGTTAGRRKVAENRSSQTQQAILGAMERLVHEYSQQTKSIFDITVPMVARMAERAPSTVYRHYKSPESIASELVNRLAAENKPIDKSLRLLANVARDRASTSEDPYERLKNKIRNSQDSSIEDLHQNLQEAKDHGDQGLIAEAHADLGSAYAYSSSPDLVKAEKYLVLAQVMTDPGDDHQLQQAIRASEISNELIVDALKGKSAEDILPLIYRYRAQLMQQMAWKDALGSKAELEDNRYEIESVNCGIAGDIEKEAENALEAAGRILSRTWTPTDPPTDEDIDFFAHVSSDLIILREVMQDSEALGTTALRLIDHISASPNPDGESPLTPEAALIRLSQDSGQFVQDYISCLHYTCSYYFLGEALYRRARYTGALRAFRAFLNRVVNFGATKELSERASKRLAELEAMPGIAKGATAASVEVAEAQRSIARLLDAIFDDKSMSVVLAQELKPLVESLDRVVARAAEADSDKFWLASTDQ